MEIKKRTQKSIWYIFCWGIIMVFIILIMKTQGQGKSEPEDRKEQALISNIVYANSFNNDCLNIWIEIRETTEIVVDSIIFKITPTTIDGKRILQVIKSKNPQQIGEEFFFIETIDGWQKETGPASDQDIEMMYILSKKIKNP